MAEVFDYAEMAAEALEIVTEFSAGRTVTLVQLDSGTVDPAEPLYGPTDPRATPVASVTLPAVFVDPSAVENLGRMAQREDWVARSTQVAVVATTQDLIKYNELIDTDGSRWRITGMRMLTPGLLPLAAYVGVAR